MTKRIQKTVPIEKVQPSALNPRKTFNPELLAELTASVAQHGILQPILVRPLGKGKGWEIVAGERRYRAALANKLTELPVVVQDLTDAEVVALAVTENEQRADVPVLEKAAGYARLVDEFGASLEDVAAQIGKSVSTIRGLLKLLKLPAKSAEALAAGTISPALATLIATRPTEALREKVEDYILNHFSEKIPSTRQVKQWMEQAVMVELKGAPFKTSAKTLLDDVGSCKECPNRSGNLPDKEKGQRGDICLDPACYYRKVSASVDRRIEALQKQGHTVMSEEERLTVFPSGGTWISSSCGYYDVDQKQYIPGLEKIDTWRSALGKQLTKNNTVKCMDGDGVERTLILSRVARSLIAPPAKKADSAADAPTPRLTLPQVPALDFPEDLAADRQLALDTYLRAVCGTPEDLAADHVQMVGRFLVSYLMDCMNSDDLVDMFRLYHQVSPDTPDDDVPEDVDLAALPPHEVFNLLVAASMAHVIAFDWRGVLHLRNWFTADEKVGAE